MMDEYPPLSKLRPLTFGIGYLPRPVLRCTCCLASESIIYSIFGTSPKFDPVV